MSEILMVTLQIMPSNERRPMELPSQATGGEIINAIMNQNVVPRTDNKGNPQSYTLRHEGSRLEIGDTQRLYELRVNNGDILTLTPKLIAG